MIDRDSHSRFWLAIAILAVLAIVSIVTAALVSGELNGTQTRLTDAEMELATIRSELAAATTELDTTEGLVEYVEATLSNLQANYARLTAGYGYVLRDPSYRELAEFLAEDETSRQEYVENEYICVDFAADVKANAAKKGIRCAYVSIEYRGGGGHAIVAFDTTDEGLVFIEPQFDWEVELEIGRPYYQCVKPPPGRYMATPDDDDTITRIIVIW